MKIPKSKFVFVFIEGRGSVPFDLGAGSSQEDKRIIGVRKIPMSTTSHSTPRLNRSDVLRLGAGGLTALLLPPTNALSEDGDFGFDVPDSAADLLQRLKQDARGLLVLEHRVDNGDHLIAAGEWARTHGLLGDAYGVGGFIEAFERRMAALLGFDAACFMPTGVMAQLATLRIIADRSQSRSVGLHPTSHHLLHEENAYDVVHNLTAEIIAPWDRPIMAHDLDAAPPLCAVSVELPVRWIGGQLQSWRELSELKRTARSKGIPLVMDGARLWECGPYYGRSYAEICRGFSAVYVSFYKMIGASNGAILAGDVDLVEESRIWRRRLGGDVYQFFPYVASAAMKFDAILPRLAGYRDQARRLSRRLSADEHIIALPNDPPTNLFRLILPGVRDELMEKRDLIARETGVWVGDSFRPTRVPGLAQVELQIGPAYQTISEDEAVDAFLRLL